LVATLVTVVFFYCQGARKTCTSGQLAYEDECLDQEIVIMLKEYANKAIKLWQTNPENQKT
jgi:hypothetical protein